MYPQDAPAPTSISQRAHQVHIPARLPGWIIISIIKEVLLLGSVCKLLPFLLRTWWYRLRSSGSSRLVPSSTPAGNATRSVFYPHVPYAHARNHTRNAREAAASAGATRAFVDVFVHRDETLSQRSGVAPAALPVLVFVHGGAWAVGDKWMHSVMADTLWGIRKQNARSPHSGDGDHTPGAAHLSDPGFVALMPNYSLYPKGTVEDMLGDLDELLSWLTLHADHIGADANQIYLCGHSAGAHLGAMLLLRRAVHDSHVRQYNAVR